MTQNHWYAFRAASLLLLNFAMTILLLLLTFVPLAVAFDCTALDQVDPFIGSSGPAYGYGGLNPG